MFRSFLINAVAHILERMCSNLLTIKETMKHSSYKNVNQLLFNLNLVKEQRYSELWSKYIFHKLFLHYIT